MIKLVPSIIISDMLLHDVIALVDFIPDQVVNFRLCEIRPTPLMIACCLCHLKDRNRRVPFPDPLVDLLDYHRFFRDDFKCSRYYSASVPEGFVQ